MCILNGNIYWLYNRKRLIRMKTNKEALWWAIATGLIIVGVLMAAGVI
jgi:hypothetical protein